MHDEFRPKHFCRPHKCDSERLEDGRFFKFSFGIGVWPACRNVYLISNQPINNQSINQSINHCQSTRQEMPMSRKKEKEKGKTTSLPTSFPHLSRSLRKDDISPSLFQDQIKHRQESRINDQLYPIDPSPIQARLNGAANKWS